MRKLIHYGTLHDDTHIHEYDTPQMKIARELYHTKLRDFYLPFSEAIVEEHRRDPFHRIYMESICDIPELGDGDFAVTLPVRVLLKEGVTLESTEHRGLDLLHSLWGGEEILKYEERLKSIRKDHFFEQFPFEPEYRQILEEFFEDGDYVNIHTARECWIGKKIARSLRNRERGVLFLGKFHSPENIKLFLPGDIEYRYIDLFPELQ
ncbi:hypothetical protein EXS74_00815 [Candidatus Woesearchaeota archaeon]|nr:hypothetical protein [Candidatus Woesearchaeota archaeon]